MVLVRIRCCQCDFNNGSSNTNTIMHIMCSSFKRMPIKFTTLPSIASSKWMKVVSYSVVDTVVPLLLRSNHISSRNGVRDRKYKHAFTGLYPRKTIASSYPCSSTLYLMNSKLASSHQWVRHQKANFSSERLEDLNPFKRHAFDYGIYEKSFQVHDHEKGPWAMILKEVEALNHLYKMSSDSLEKLTILTLAAGPGELPISLAKAIPEAQVCATDISSRMIELASNKAKDLHLNNMNSLTLDMDNLTQFDDQSFDIVTCCYGLAHADDVYKALNEIHRVLKPGGTLLITVWEHLSTEPIIDSILNSICQGHTIPSRTIDPTKLSMPYLLEEQIEKRGLKIIKVLHEEYPFILPSVFEAPNDAFAFTTLYAKEELGKLVRSGTNPYAFEDAQKTFDDIVAKGVLAHYEDGKVVIEGNRYKMIVARRDFEDGDTLQLLRRQGQISSSEKGKGFVGTVKPFDDTLIDVYSRTNSIPWGHIVTSVKGILQHHDMHQVNILDLATARGQLAILMAQLFPDASVHAVDVSSDLIDQANKEIRSKGLMNLHTKVADVHDLSVYQDASFDIITCSFGLPFFARPEVVLHEVHRLLKPGGSLVITNWERLVIDRISDLILERLSGKVGYKDRDIDPMTLSEPKTVEALVEASDLSLVNVDHEEFHLKLSDDDGPKDISFQAVVGPIRSELNQLIASGQNPNAMLDARVIFEKLLQDKKMIHKDDDGSLVTSANRYKLLVARRQYEDRLQ